MKRILIIIPCYGSALPECVEGVVNLITICKNKYDIKVKFITGYTVDVARNEAVQYFLSTDSDYLLFVDSDIVVTESVFEKLIAADKPIVTGVYNKKTLLKRETTICYIDEENQWKSYAPDEIKNELFICEACGFGCTLIKRDVLRIMSEKQNKICFRFIQSALQVSEDIYFCLECKKNGIDVWCDGSAKVGHVGKFIY